MAVERFVSVGEAIAYENPTIKLDMLEACKEARESGYTIKIHTQMPNSISMANSQSEKNNLIQAANILLNSITKVLLLADVVIINQILNSKNKVSRKNTYFTRCNLISALNLNGFRGNVN